MLPNPKSLYDFRIRRILSCTQNQSVRMTDFPTLIAAKNSSGNSKDIGKLFLNLLHYFKMHDQYLKRIHDENTTCLYSMD